MEKKENEKPAPQAKEAAPRPHAPKAEKPHRIKVTEMSLQEIEQALEKAREHMGGLHSQYAQALLIRRDHLSRQSAAAQRKAA